MEHSNDEVNELLKPICDVFNGSHGSEPFFKLGDLIEILIKKPNIDHNIKEIIILDTVRNFSSLSKTILDNEIIKSLL